MLVGGTFVPHFHREDSPVLLTCPTCRSGLQVPDGTTALVRCPACKTVFSPDDGLAPPDDEDDEPRPKKSSKKKEPEAPPDNENRDFDPSHFEDKPRKRRRRRFDETDDDSLTIEERRSLKAAFTRAAWGCRLLWISFSCFMFSMLIIVFFWFQGSWLVGLDPTYVTVAGIIGMFTWITGAIGVGLCLSGPWSPGHWGYGIAAAVATVVHLVMLAVLVGKGTDYSIGKEAEPVGANAKWGLVPTRLDAVTFYVTLMVYRDEEVVPKGDLKLSIVVGVIEMIRNRPDPDAAVVPGPRHGGRGRVPPVYPRRRLRLGRPWRDGGHPAPVRHRHGRDQRPERRPGENPARDRADVDLRLLHRHHHLGVCRPQATADACDEPYQSRIPKL